MNMQSRTMGGFRALTNDEIMAVSGGADDAMPGDIVVTAQRRYIPPTYQDTLPFRRANIAEFGGASLGDGGGETPQRVTVDSSCAGHPEANDPTVQAAALSVLNTSTTTGREHGFFASANIFSSGFSVSPEFTSGHHDRILGEVILRNMNGVLPSLFNGTFSPSLFVHGHPNNAPPSPVSLGDQRFAAQQNIPVAAIDRAGNMTCTGN